MKKLKLDAVQKHKIDEAYRNAAQVLNKIKQEHLEGDALAHMKTLEEAVSGLETFRLVTNN